MKIRKDTAVASIYRSVLALLSPKTPRGVYKAVLVEAARLANAEYGAIFLPRAGMLHRVYSTTPPSGQFNPRPRGYTYMAYNAREIKVINFSEVKRTHPDVIAHGVRSFIMIPLLVRGDRIGIITLQSKKDYHFDSNKIQVLQLFASVASLQIRKRQLYDQLQKDLYLRQQFVALASHEIKTPLTVLSTYSQLLRKQVHDGKPVQKKWVDMLFEETQIIKQIINEFLAPYAVNPDQLEFHWEKINIARLVNSVFKQYKLTHTAANIVFSASKRTSAQATCWADKNKLRQVFINVINNAIKFSPEGSPIIIAVSMTRTKIKVSVEDSGAGIQASDLPHIFNPFYRGRQQKKPGMGMGLFLTKTIVKAHNGKIKIESAISKGTKVTISLPRFKE